MQILQRRPGPTSRPTVPGYEIVSPVGFGAGGAAWSARSRLGRPVVVSFVQLPEGERGTALLRRLEALRSTADPHLLRVIDVVGLGEGRCALVAEEVPGPNLVTVRIAQGDLTPGGALTLLGALASALGRLHEMGIVHGDVAPSNIVLTAGGVPVLLDLAGEVTHERGTPGFVAPERRVGDPASASADVWALAQVVRWATGGHPDVDRALARALSPDPRDRPRARELAAEAAALGTPRKLEVPSEADLAQARLRSGEASTQPARPRRPRGRHRRRRATRKALVVVAACAAVLGGVTGVAVRWGSGTQEVDAATAEQVVDRLVAARDEAIADGDAQALARLTVPGTAAAERDAALLADLGDAGVRPSGLHTEVADVRLIDARTGADGGWRVEVVTRQGEYTLAGSGPRSGTVVPAQEPSCTVLEVAGPAPWRIAGVAPCG
ncbi:hypothetical protein GCM10023169_39420 [Georgenia halophila]|uniref:Protein kinase domain-containing protein n=1 Tax=Georgenia halophila TaxID=620889 RepID=A0ABP8LPW8_9MICO